MRLIPCRIQLLVAALLHERLTQLVARSVAVCILLVDEERGIRPIAREVRVAFVRFDDLIDERQHERHVRTRTDGQPLICLRRRAREARIHADHLSTALLRALHSEPVVVPAAALLTAPDQDAISIVAIPTGVLGLIPVEALAGEVAAHPAQVAHAEGGGGAQLQPQLVDGLELEHVTTSAVLVRDGVPPVFVADPLELLGGLSVGVIPADATPLAGALLPYAALRIADARRVVQLLRDGERTPAERPLAEQVGIALDLRQAPILDGPEQGASAIALTACAGDDLHVIGCARITLCGNLCECRIRAPQHHGRRRCHSARLDEVAAAELQCHAPHLLPRLSPTMSSCLALYLLAMQLLI